MWIINDTAKCHCTANFNKIFVYTFTFVFTFVFKQFIILFNIIYLQKNML